MTMRNRFVCPAKVKDIVPDPGPDPGPDPESKPQSKDLDHMIVKEGKGWGQVQEKAESPIIFGGQDLLGGTGSRGDQDQLNVIETVGNEPRTGELGSWSNLHKTSGVLVSYVSFDLLS